RRRGGVASRSGHSEGARSRVAAAGGAGGSSGAATASAGAAAFTSRGARGVRPWAGFAKGSARPVEGPSTTPRSSPSGAAPAPTEAGSARCGGRVARPPAGVSSSGRRTPGNGRRGISGAVSSAGAASSLRSSDAVAAALSRVGSGNPPRRRRGLSGTSLLADVVASSAGALVLDANGAAVFSAAEVSPAGRLASSEGSPSADWSRRSIRPNFPPNPAAPAATTAAAPVAAALSGLLSPSGVSSVAGERRSPGNRRPASSPLLLAGASAAPLSPAPGLRSVPAASVVAGDGSPGAGDSALPGRRITGCERAP